MDHLHDASELSPLPSPESTCNPPAAQEEPRLLSSPLSPLPATLPTNPINAPSSTISVSVPRELARPSPQRTDLHNNKPDSIAPAASPLRPAAGQPPEHATPTPLRMSQIADEEMRARQLQAAFMASPKKRNASTSSDAIAASSSDPELRTLATIMVFVATWNMNNRKKIEDSFTPLFQQDHDLYVLGCQECSLDRENLVQKLDEALGPSFLQLRVQELESIKLCVYVRKTLSKQLEAVETADIPTKLGGLLKTKGAVGLSFKVAGTSFLFVNSHFSAHQGAVSDRNRDYRTICTGLPLPHQDHVEQAFQLISSSRKHRNVTELFDRVFWMGDLNYRVDLSREEVDDKLEMGNYLTMLQFDQLSLEREQMRTFMGFSEQAITFKPTYKFDRGTDTYDTSEKRRIPSWTDRILFRSTKEDSIHCDLYDSCNDLKESDHKPVFGSFRVSIPDGKWQMQTHDSIETGSLNGLMEMVNAVRLNKTGDHSTALVGLSALSATGESTSSSSHTGIPSRRRSSSSSRFLSRSSSRRDRNRTRKNSATNRTVSSLCQIS